MVIGCLGNVVFEVSAETVHTVDKLTWSGSARWAVHNRHGGNALTEFTGLDPDEISFSVYLSAYLGVAPLGELEKIWMYERNGTPVSLVMGEKWYGKYRWAVKDHKTSAESYDGKGNLVSCTVTLDLLEYLRE